MQSRDFLLPNTPYEIGPGPDGKIVLVELVAKEPPLVVTRRVEGRLRGAKVNLDRVAVAASIRAERGDL